MNPGPQSKDDEVARRIQAYVARTSILRSRLLSALDTIDVLERSHHEELSAVTAERDQMQLKLQRYIDSVKSAQLERDEMRDAVMKLVEKVEMSNDYSKWPHSQISLQSLADVLPLSRKIPNSVEGMEDLYASSLIDLLHKELVTERNAHARTREIADAQIVALDAKLSRRDAELESCIANADHMLSLKDRPPRSVRSMKKQVPLEGEPMSREEIIAALDMTTARNRMLETELKILAKRLEEARQRPTSGNQSDMDAERSSMRSMTIPEPQGIALSEPNYGRFKTGSQLLALENQINILGSKIDSFAVERRVTSQSIASSSRHFEQESPHPHPPPPPPSDELHKRLEQENECHRLRRTETLLREQLNDARADAREREAMLLSQINSLKLELDRRKTETVSHGAPSSPGPVLENLLEPNEGELSMELATPLMPTTVLTQPCPSGEPQPPPSLHSPSLLSWHVQNNRTSDDPLQERPPDTDALRHGGQGSSYIDPPSIPLPSSPEGLSAWEVNSDSEFTISASAFPLPPQLLVYASPTPGLTTLGRVDDKR